ncbi:MAG: transglycosylase SLT domain-containing protein [Kangiellaceae bacterium]|nr:transglycosylase SLT domain-containing protein [Kangiellaceae bacterium]MCW8997950.1 transglycosylase SLT domain-containing protein [Kangiellaceae bacterium]MCW9017976.1 transglycosylase SLT domain-containing protein [Kangiellaceae bacterium]
MQFSRTSLQRVFLGLTIALMSAVFAVRLQASTSQLTQQKPTKQTENQTQAQKTAQLALFKQAEQAIRNKQFSKFLEVRENLKTHPLIDYLERDYLISDLSLANREKIEQFLAQNGHLPVSRKLRYKWLHWLGKHNHASLFLRHYQNFGSKSLNCHQLYFRLRTSENKNDIYPQIEKIWLSPTSLPKSCDKLILLWKKHNGLNDDLIWQRLLLSQKARNRSLSKYLASQLSASSQPAAKLLTTIATQPKKLFKTKLKVPLTTKANQIIRFGLNKLAWSEPQEAIKVWQHLADKYQYVDTNHSLRRAISLSLAIDKEPEAMDWLNSNLDKHDESINQWMLSTAISKGDWSLVEKLSTNLIDIESETNKWIYWRAVAQTQLGLLNEAQQLFSSIADQRNYYGFLAARQLKQQAKMQYTPINFTEDQLLMLVQHPAAIRAKTFYEMQRMTDARREWNYLVSQTPTKDQIKLAAIAHSWNWQHQAILAFARSKQINDVAKRFPLEHLSQFQSHSSKHNIPLSWAYAVTRQESAFKADAISSAGARGLMQLTPATAKQVAKSAKGYRRVSQLLKADTNIALGTAHLSQVYKSFDYHPVLATAAYNAGKHKVKKWLKTTTTQDSIQWIEQIPYKETREYVKNVLTYQLIYARLTNSNDSFIAKLDKMPIKQAANTSQIKLSK